MSNSWAKVERFNAAVCDDAKSLVRGAYYLSEDRICCHGCRSCTNTATLGTPHDGKKTIYHNMINTMGDAPINLDLYPYTKILFLEPIPWVDTGRMFSHLHMVGNVNPLNDLRAKFFAGTTLRKRHVDELKDRVCSWFTTNSGVLCEMFPHLRNDIAGATARAVRDAHHVMSLPPLKLVEWLNDHMMRAASMMKLVKVTLTGVMEDNINLITAKFDPTMVGLNANEQALKKTYSNAEFILRWSATCDLDLHVTMDNTQTNHMVHVSFKNKSAPGIALDQDNTRGGPGAQEVISFDPKTLMEAGFTHATVHVFLYSDRGIESIPFEVTVNQHGQTTVYKGSWKRGDGTGSTLENACWSETIELLEPPAKVESFLRHKFPSGFSLLRMSDVSQLVTQVPATTLEAGTGIPVWALLRTPGGDFRSETTPIRVGGKGAAYQLSHTVNCTEAIGVGDKKYAYVGESPLCDLPLVLMFTKEMFPFGAEGLKNAGKYRGKVYSPHPNWQLDAILGELGIPDVLSRFILAYATEPQIISLFASVHVRSGTREAEAEQWWSAYL